ITAYGVRETLGSGDAGGVRVTVNGLEAQVLAVENIDGQERVRVVIPQVIRSPTAIVVSRDGVASAPAFVAVHEVQPAIFAFDSGDAVVVRYPGNTLVTAADPVAAGGIVYFYANGLGSAPETTRVTIGGAECEVFYAGPAPGLPGVSQINVRLAAGVPPGRQEMRLTIGGAVSPAVTMALR
ncbi:MAG: hypothetical protein ACRD44_17550, partial [Bryobacteraceae bacterium]